MGTTRKHFKTTADIIASQLNTFRLVGERELLYRVASRMAYMFGSDNSNFSKSRFMAVCFPHGMEAEGLPNAKPAE